MLIGIDIENIKKMERIIDGIDFNNYQGVLNSIFSEEEIAYCFKKQYPAQHFAVRYAGKEAFLKALGTGLSGNFIMSEVYFTNDLNGQQPQAHCIGNVKEFVNKKEIEQIKVSFSHTKETAVAIVIMEIKIGIK